MRRVLGKTPPQVEQGWHRLIKVSPRSQDARYDGMVEIYDFEADRLARVDDRGLCPHRDEYYWRTIKPGDAQERCDRYARASQSAFG
jgi:hypothetical protein